MSGGKLVDAWTCSSHTVQGGSNDPDDVEVIGSKVTITCVYL